MSIGIGCTKTLAKIANRVAKKDPETKGVFNLFEAADVDAVLASIEVGDIWGVGRQWSAWLEGQGIGTALDLKRANSRLVRTKMTVVGEQIVRELNGVSCLPLDLLRAPQEKGSRFRDPSAGCLARRNRSGKRWCAMSAALRRNFAADI